MKVAISTDEGKPYGIELIAENEADKEILKRFWEGGVKTNRITNNHNLQLTFKDLIQEQSAEE